MIGIIFTNLFLFNGMFLIKVHKILKKLKKVLDYLKELLYN